VTSRFMGSVIVTGTEPINVSSQGFQLLRRRNKRSLERPWTLPPLSYVDLFGAVTSPIP